MKELPPLADLAAALAPHVAEIAENLTGGKPTSRTAREIRFGSKGSLAVVIAGADRGSYFDHQAGEGGDALSLIAHLRRCSIGEAATWARSYLGFDGTTPPRPEPKAAAPTKQAEPAEPSATLELARTIWREAIPAGGTLVEVYLASRQLLLPAAAPIRFHPSCPRGNERLPAMLALMTDPATARPCGVHRTFLTANGDGKSEGQAKMMTGNAGVIRLVPDAEVTMGLGLAEGIETAIAAALHLNWSPIWAATSAGAIRTFPILAGIVALTVFADPDGAGLTAAEACAARWQAGGREAGIWPAPTTKEEPAR